MAPLTFNVLLTVKLVVAALLLAKKGRSPNTYLTVAPVPLEDVAINNSSSTSGVPEPPGASLINPPVP